MAFRHAFAARFGALLLMKALASDELCTSGGLAEDGASFFEKQHHSLMQQRFKTTGSLMVSDSSNAQNSQLVCTGGNLSVGRCWYLGEVGQNCDDTCGARGLVYSFAAPEQDMTPQLVGHMPKKNDPWIFVECYVPSEDRYHPANPNAWGVPAKTPVGEMTEVGKKTYDSCRLTCPCADAGSPAAPLPTPTPTGGGLVPTPGGTSSVLSCSGVIKNDRCWYLSAVGKSCGETCGSHGPSCNYSYAAPPEQDMVAELLGHIPYGKQDAWLFVECYVPKEDRYHPFNPNAWGVPSKTPADEVASVGEFSYETCRLSCPCQGTCSGAALPLVPAPGIVTPEPAPVPAPPGSTMPTVPLTCQDGIVKNDRCWYMSSVGGSCGDTCGAHGCSYLHSAPPEGDMVAELVGHVPHGKQDPWLFVECYVPKEDRYHPYNPNAWGVPAKTPVGELASVAQFKQDSCRLSCPCAGTCTFTNNSVPVPLPAPEPVPVPVPAPVPAGPLCSDGVGLNASGRCWYLSETGASCDATCAARGSTFLYASTAQEMVPKLVGYVPKDKQDPWLFVECFVPPDDRYHPANKNAWGVPAKTPQDEMGKVGAYAYPTCRLACPCAGAAPIQPIQPVSPPAPMPPAAPPTPSPTPGNYTGDCVGGFISSGRCWYLGETGASCDQTCSSHGSFGLGCQYSFALPIKDVTPQLIGHDPHGIQAPWLFVECYVQKEDRYHPANPNAWGVPAKTPTDELSKVGAYNYETCMLSCPCTGTCVDTAAPDVSPPVVVPVPAPMPLPPTPPGKTSCSWTAPKECSAKFMYRDVEYTGCADNVAYPSPWCSHDPVHAGKWSVCEFVCM